MNLNESGIKSHQYSHDLEGCMETLGFTEFSADYCKSNPADAVVSALNYMCTNNCFPEEELAGYLEEYHFPEGNFAEVMMDEGMEEKFCEFIVFVKAYLK